MERSNYSSSHLVSFSGMAKSQQVISFLEVDCSICLALAPAYSLVFACYRGGADPASRLNLLLALVLV